MLPRRPGWLDNLLIFFLSGLQKLEQWAKKCIELRGEYVEKIPSLVTVACFLPGRAKVLSAPPRVHEVTVDGDQSCLRIKEYYSVIGSNILLVDTVYVRCEGQASA